MAALIARRVGMHVVPGLPCEDAAQLRELPADGRGHVTVLRLCDELRFPGGLVLKTRPAGIRRRARARSAAGLAGPQAADGVSRQLSGSGAGELAR